MKEKWLILIFILLQLISCRGQNSNKQQDKLNNMFETFDYNKFEKENERYKDPDRSDVYLFEKGRQIWASWKDIYEIPAYPNVYLVYKEFYEHLNKPSTIKEKGKYVGDLELGSNAGVKIGKWYYFDENGKLVKEANEDDKFGKFDYNEVFKFLDKKNEINIRTGEGREKIKIVFYFSDKSTSKLWIVKIKTGEPYGVANLPEDKGTRGGQNFKIYCLDGNTGEVFKTTDKKLLEYKNIIPNFEQQFPWLIK